MRFKPILLVLVLFGVCLVCSRIAVKWGLLPRVARTVRFVLPAVVKDDLGQSSTVPISEDLRNLGKNICFRSENIISDVIKVVMVTVNISPVWVTINCKVGRHSCRDVSAI